MTTKLDYQASVEERHYFNYRVEVDVTELGIVLVERSQPYRQRNRNMPRRRKLITRISVRDGGLGPDDKPKRSVARFKFDTVNILKDGSHGKRNVNDYAYGWDYEVPEGELLYGIIEQELWARLMEAYRTAHDLEPEPEPEAKVKATG